MQLPALIEPLFRRLPRSGPLAGVLMMLLSAAAFASMHASIRHVSHQMHPFEIAFFRVTLGFAALAPVFIRHGIAPLRTTKLRLFALRALLNTGAMLMFFYSLSITPLATATALGFSAPLFATVLAALILGETVRLRRWTAIGIGFVGALVILRPGVIEIGLGPILVIGSSAIWAFALMVIKVLTRTESSVTITAYASALLTPTTLAATLIVDAWTWPTLDVFLWLCLIGGLGTVAQTAMNQALKMADASAVMPFDFTRLIWASAIGLAAFGEWPDFWTWFGGGMIFAAATYVGIRESRLKRAAPLPVDSAAATGDKPRVP